MAKIRTWDPDDLNAYIQDLEGKRKTWVSLEDDFGTLDELVAELDAMKWLRGDEDHG